ncbi:hypothetical protein KUV50_14965 [Membranicola marinus]|uniref:PorZ N-terminal beta-propeller domain-containing protein n=1 Tax=Membranihabitans marinus TaxID=1227546 RepID=A0A953HVW8_9BACT|nr:hypothetical protein [Membranihabitans marinus]MBY5959450.1 hypothetical protein [Membranihabitans marinus]
MRQLPQLILIPVLFALTQGFAQQQNALFELGSWRSYFPAGEYTEVVAGDESVIVVNPYQLVVYYPDSEGDILLLNKGNGLSDVGISSVQYLPTQDAIVVGYVNGNVDIVTPDRTYNLPGIKNNQNILTSKRINDIGIAGERIYLATDFGIVEINVGIHEFGSTLFTDDPMEGVAWNDNERTLYAFSELELYRLQYTPSTNLADINQWHIAPSHVGGMIRDIAVWKENTYMVANDSLWIINSDQVFDRVPVTGSEVRYIKPSGTHLLVVNQYSNIFTWDGNHSRQFINLCLLPLRDVLMIDLESFWYLTKEEFGQYADNECEVYELTGVPSRFVTEMTVMDGDLFVATGGVTRIYNNLFREDGFYTNDGGAWRVFNLHTVPELGALNMRDIYTVEKVVDRNEVYFGTFWGGVIRYKEGQITLFDESNSSLGFSVTNPDRIRIADLFLDGRDNLWVANHDAIRPLSVMNSSGEWHNFSIPTGPRIEKLVVDEYENIWMAIAERGLLIMRPNDWMNDNDDETRLIIPQPDDGNGTGFDNARINEIAVDRNGGVWLGTESGPVLFDCGNFVFDQICKGRKPVLELNGQLGVLLRNENVKAIAIDGGNRKWFGTTNGVYVVNGALDRIDNHFTVDNSPLPSNSITDIAINQTSGEVFIATDEGLVSYRGAATESNPGSFEQMAVFPNPVPPAYKGPVGVKNLPENALVRIATLGGRLIYENRAQGGQLVWDRRDQDGRPVASGIYLVFATLDQSVAPFTQVGKVFLLD